MNHRPLVLYIIYIYSLHFLIFLGKTNNKMRENMSLILGCVMDAKGQRIKY